MSEGKNAKLIAEGRAEKFGPKRIALFQAKWAANDSGCWLWTGALNNAGYGQFWDGVRVILAHRYSFELSRGGVPDGLQLDHLCRVRNCVNPEHLEAVTSSENSRRGALGFGDGNLCRSGRHDVSDPESVIELKRGGRLCRECSNSAKRERNARNGSTEHERAMAAARSRATRARQKEAATKANPYRANPEPKEGEG